MRACGFGTTVCARSVRPLTRRNPSASLLWMWVSTRVEGLEQYCENGFVATNNGPTGDPPEDE